VSFNSSELTHTQHYMLGVYSHCGNC